MNKLVLKKRAQILRMLVEGNSPRSTSRTADVSINTVTKLLVDVGAACAEFQAKILVICVFAGFIIIGFYHIEIFLALSLIAIMVGLWNATK